MLDNMATQHEKGEVMMSQYWERPCAAKGWVSYRYRGRYGWVMIGAVSIQDALREVTRSIVPDIAEIEKLEVWNGTQYTSITE